LVEVMAAAVAGGERRLLLDLSGVDYVSSAGLTALGAIARRIADAGGAMVLCGLTEPVRLVFDLGGLLSQFTIAASLPEGVALARPSGHE
jgi:stage II sporulation protein AA (anti-sigma F factor antagonist)